MGNYLVHRNNEYFVKVPMEVINDDDLSLEAKGMLVWMLSRPDDWNFSLAGMMSALNKGKNRNGRDSIQSAMRQLCDIGYLRVQKDVRLKGRFASVYHIFDHRVTSQEEASLASCDEALIPESQDIDISARTADEDGTTTKAVIVPFESKDSDISTGGAPSHRCGFPAAVDRQQDKIREKDNNKYININPSQSKTGKPVAARPVPTSSRGIAACPIVEDIPMSTAAQAGSGRVGSDVDKRRVFDALCTRSINRSFSYGKSLEWSNFCARLKEGYSTEQIEQAYAHYTQRYKSAHPDTNRYAMRLSGWLSERGDGLVFDADRPKRQTLSKMPYVESGQNDPYEELAERDDVFNRMLSERAHLYCRIAKMKINGSPSDGVSEAEKALEDLSRRIEGYLVTKDGQLCIDGIDDASSDEGLKQRHGEGNVDG
jgi:hypothetical protein